MYFKILFKFRGPKNIEYILLVEKIILTVAGMTVTSEWWRGVSWDEDEMRFWESLLREIRFRCWVTTWKCSYKQQYFHKRWKLTFTFFRDFLGLPTISHEYIFEYFFLKCSAYFCKFWRFFVQIFGSSAICCKFSWFSTKFSKFVPHFQKYNVFHIFIIFVLIIWLFSYLHHSNFVSNIYVYIYIYIKI